MKFVSIDIETTGLDHYACDTLEFGAAIFDTEDHPLAKPKTFHAYLVPTNAGEDLKGGTFSGEPYALFMHSKTGMFEKIAKLSEPFKYLHPNDLAKCFRAFLDENGLTGKIVIAGKNYANFDKKFLSHIDDWDNLILSHHRMIDPGSMYMRRNDTSPPDLKTCLERAGLPNTVTHTALEDAIQVGELVMKLLVV